jgi:hypothetical protein
MFPTSRNNILKGADSHGMPIASCATKAKEIQPYPPRTDAALNSVHSKRNDKSETDGSQVSFEYQPHRSAELKRPSHGGRTAVAAVRQYKTLAQPTTVAVCDADPPSSKRQKLNSGEQQDEKMSFTIPEWKDLCEDVLTCLVDKPTLREALGKEKDEDKVDKLMEVAIAAYRVLYIPREDCQKYKFLQDTVQRSYKTNGSILKATAVMLEYVPEKWSDLL